MLFNSFEFAIFLPIVFTLYWLAFHRDLKIQNLFLLIASYIFYGWWDWRFLFLLFFISASNYTIAILVQNKENKSFSKFIFIVGLLINLGTLVLFKYFNFFIDGFSEIINLFGLNFNITTLQIILPLGISFYIFLSISYIIDVYQGKLIAARNLIDVLLTLSFFPIILAGPIHRPVNLLPQIQTIRRFNYTLATDGLRQILWGLFMKIVIADQCANYVDTIFSNSDTYTGSTLLTGIFLFTIQIYADFGGYSNIAIGIGKLLGFNLMQNFAYPYFARDIREFWRRWHISLTTWFRDYIFLPVAYLLTRKIQFTRILGIKKDWFIYVISITLTWLLTGLWHGANYTFIVWGILHGLLLLINRIINKPRKRLIKKFDLRESNTSLIIIETLSTFIIVMFTWIFFRADSITHALDYISGIFSASIFTAPSFPDIENALVTVIFILVFMTVEWFGRGQQYAIADIWLKWKLPARYAIYYLMVITILWFSGKEQQFIYFQF
ncbi:MAG: MBOAT family protein [bacterium]|nr:MBOAT family protein [bacterium]